MGSWPCMEILADKKGRAIADPAVFIDNHKFQLLIIAYAYLKNRSILYNH
jgi:hypothetical protein